MQSSSKTIYNLLTYYRGEIAKFWSILLEFWVKHKTWNCEEWVIVILDPIICMLEKFANTHLKFLFQFLSVKQVLIFMNRCPLFSTILGWLKVIITIFFYFHFFLLYLPIYLFNILYTHNFFKGYRYIKSYAYFLKYFLTFLMCTLTLQKKP